MTVANYEIVNENERVVLIKDLGPWDEHPTVTNDAEAVVAELSERLGDRELVYIDSDGNPGEIIVKEGVFWGFGYYPNIPDFENTPPEIEQATPLDEVRWLLRSAHRVLTLAEVRKANRRGRKPGQSEVGQALGYYCQSQRSNGSQACRDLVSHGFLINKSSSGAYRMVINKETLQILSDELEQAGCRRLDDLVLRTPAKFAKMFTKQGRWDQLTGLSPTEAMRKLKQGT